MHPSDISLIGLFLDIGGAILIWKFGLPEEVYRSGRVPAIYNPATPEETAKIKKYDRLSKLGVIALIFGFALQFVGTAWARFFPPAFTVQSEVVAPR